MTGRTQYPEKVGAPGTSKNSLHWPDSDHSSDEDEHGRRWAEAYLAFAAGEKRAWLRENRLDGFSKLLSEIGPEDTEKTALLQSMRQTAPAAVAKLFEYMQALDDPAQATG